MAQWQRTHDRILFARFMKENGCVRTLREDGLLVSFHKLYASDSQSGWTQWSFVELRRLENVCLRDKDHGAGALNWRAVDQWDTVQER